MGEERPRVSTKSYRPEYPGHSRFQILKLNILLFIHGRFTTRLSKSPYIVMPVEGAYKFTGFPGVTPQPAILDTADLKLQAHQGLFEGQILLDEQEVPSLHTVCHLSRPSSVCQVLNRPNIGISAEFPESPVGSIPIQHHRFGLSTDGPVQVDLYLLSSYSTGLEDTYNAVGTYGMDSTSLNCNENGSERAPQSYLNFTNRLGTNIPEATALYR
ncbi:hypothetical protein F4860DRAFT_515738 [Xylaria cubensis]|nr:hypothetical protein F4860DRAFT_515738 [Xylaria cubensis]